MSFQKTQKPKPRRSQYLRISAMPNRHNCLQAYAGAAEPERVIGLCGNLLNTGADMTLSVELFWSFRSPYSYILLPRIITLLRDFDVTVDLRTVHPAALRNPAYFGRMDPLARPYFIADSAREAAFRDMPFRRPIPDPINQDPVTQIVAAERAGRSCYAVELDPAYCDVAVRRWEMVTGKEASVRMCIRHRKYECFVG